MIESKCRIAERNISSKSFAGKHRQNEGCFVNLLAVVLAQLFLFFGSPATKRLFEVAVGVLAAHHEANLAGGVGRDRRVGVFDCGKDLLACFLEVGDKGHV